MQPFLQRFFVFILLNDVWIYILCAFGLFWYGIQLVQAQRQLRQAMFGLERETGTRTRNTALFFVILLSGIIGFVYYVNAQVAPTLPAEVLKPPTPTPDPFVTPLASPSPPVTAVPTESDPLLAPTATLPGAGPPIPNATATVTLPPFTPTPFVGCTPTLNITDPANGAAVNGPVSFFGTADTPNFGYYKLEANGPETDGQWSSLLGRTIDQRVNESFLGSATLSDWAPGPYLIRLTAVDTEGNETGLCVIQVTLQNE